MSAPVLFVFVVSLFCSVLTIFSVLCKQPSTEICNLHQCILGTNNIGHESECHIEVMNFTGECTDLNWFPGVNASEATPTPLSDVFVYSYCYTSDNTSEETCQGSGSLGSGIGMNVSFVVMDPDTTAVLFKFWTIDGDTRYQGSGSDCFLFDFRNQSKLELAQKPPFYFWYDCYNNLTANATYGVELVQLPGNVPVVYQITLPSAERMFPDEEDLYLWQPSIAVELRTDGDIGVLFTHHPSLLCYNVDLSRTDGSDICGTRLSQIVKTPLQKEAVLMAEFQSVPPGEYYVGVSAADQIECEGNYLTLVSMSYPFNVSGSHVCPSDLNKLGLDMKQLIALVLGIIAGGGLMFLVLFYFCWYKRRKHGYSRSYDTTLEIKVPRVFIAYSYDHTCHAEAVEKFASFLKKHCYCQVLLDQWEKTEQCENPIVWQKESIAMADYIVCVASTGTHSDRIHRNAQTVDQVSWKNLYAFALEQIRELMQTELMKDEPRLQKFINVFFPYSNKTDIPRSLETRQTFPLMSSFSALNHHLHDIDEAVNLPGDDYNETTDGQSLLDCINKTIVYYDENPCWFEDFLQEIMEVVNDQEGSSNERNKNKGSSNVKKVDDGSTRNDDDTQVVHYENCPCPDCQKKMQLKLVNPNDDTLIDCSDAENKSLLDADNMALISFTNQATQSFMQQLQPLYQTGSCHNSNNGYHGNTTFEAGGNHGNSAYHRFNALEQCRQCLPLSAEDNFDIFNFLHGDSFLQLPSNSDGYLGNQFQLEKLQIKS